MTDVARIEKAKPRKKAKKTRNTDTADALFSLIIRAPGRCVIDGCSKTTGLQAAHGFSRRYRSVRYDERNCFCMCQGHHVYYTHRPLEWDEWLRARLGPDLYEELRETALRGGRTDFKVLLPSLRARHRELYSEAPGSVY